MILSCSQLTQTPLHFVPYFRRHAARKRVQMAVRAADWAAVRDRFKSFISLSEMGKLRISHVLTWRTW
jgi:hypothetical protein